MSKQDRLAWEAKGRPWQLMRPAADLRDRLRGYGYTVYDLGDLSHLDREPPQDHTPYSETGWPGQARYGWVYAIDIMPPTKAGLPSLQQLGAQLLADRRASVGGIRWLKYMNWEPEGDYTGPCYHEAWQPTYRRTSSSDRGHIHLSGLTGYETSTAGVDYDPVARIRGDSFMALSEAEQNELLKLARAINGRLQGVVRLEPSVPSSWSSQNPQGQDALPVVPLLAELASSVRELRARPATPVELDYDQLADALLRRIAATPPA